MRKQDLGCVFEVLAHVLGQHAHADRGEVVDGETGVLRIVLGEEPLPVLLQARLAEAFGERLEAELLLDLLKEDLDKDSRAAGRVLFVHVDDGERGPAHTVGRIEVTEEARDVAEAVGLVSMDGVVVVAEALFEVVGPLAMELAEALAHVAVELAVGALLGAALYDHVAKLNVLTFGNLELEELVHALFKVERGHDGEIDGSPQVGKVGLGPVVNLELSLCSIRVGCLALV